jgi:hypothetical protein
MGNYIVGKSIGLLLLGSHVFASPSTNQLGDIYILAADDLISMCSIERPCAAFSTLLTMPEATDNSTTSAALLLSSPATLSSALKACESLSEGLWSPSASPFTAGLNSSLAYEVYSGRLASAHVDKPVSFKTGIKTFWTSCISRASSSGTKMYSDGCSRTDSSRQL